MMERRMDSVTARDVTCDALSITLGVVRVGEKLFYHFPSHIGDKIEGATLVVRTMTIDDEGFTHLFFEFKSEE